MKRKVPRLRTDEEAEAFLDQDLSDLDFSQFQPAGFEFENKSERINMRVPKPLLDALKRRASHRGIPYTRFIRELMEREISRPERAGAFRRAHDRTR
jgi:predicted DNA binding CopG/RHH family protein